jgi:hypothetical protein
VSDAPPSHFGWLGFVPIWAWDVDAEAPTLKTRLFLPEFLLGVVAGMQVLACDVLGMEPVFQLRLDPLGPRQVRWWRAERWLVGERETP